MTKLFSSLITAVMMAAGLVAFAASPATAACPYSGCVPTNTFIKAPNQVDKGDRAKICIHVGTDGNGQPKGTVSIKVVRSKGDFRFVDSRTYNDWNECFKTPRLELRGNYVIKANFDKKPGSRWKDSDNTDEFRVVSR